MTGNRHFAKETERRQREAIRELRREQGCEFSSCPNLTGFIVRAPKDVIVELCGMAVEAARAMRPWFTQGTTAAGEGMQALTFYAGPEDAARVRAMLREHGISEVHR